MVRVKVSNPAQRRDQHGIRLFRGRGSAADARPHRHAARARGLVLPGRNELPRPASDAMQRRRIDRQVNVIYGRVIDDPDVHAGARDE